MDPIVTPLLLKIGAGIFGAAIAWMFGSYIWRTLQSSLSSFMAHVRSQQYGIRAARAMRKGFALVRKVARMASIIYGIVDQYGAAWSLVSELVDWLSVPSEVVEVIEQEGEYAVVENA